ncbi:MAG: hypothetical protein V1776_04590 [Candidatus Diapherotrites archaeon]
MRLMVLLGTVLLLLGFLAPVGFAQGADPITIRAEPSEPIVDSEPAQSIGIDRGEASTVHEDDSQINEPNSLPAEEATVELSESDSSDSQIPPSNDSSVIETKLLPTLGSAGDLPTTCRVSINPQTGIVKKICSINGSFDEAHDVPTNVTGPISGSFDEAHDLPVGVSVTGPIGGPFDEAHEVPTTATSVAGPFSEASEQPVVQTESPSTIGTIEDAPICMVSINLLTGAMNKICPMDGSFDEAHDVPTNVTGPIDGPFDEAHDLPVGVSVTGPIGGSFDEAHESPIIGSADLPTGCRVLIDPQTGIVRKICPVDGPFNEADEQPVVGTESPSTIGTIEDVPICMVSINLLTGAMNKICPMDGSFDEANDVPTNVTGPVDGQFAEATDQPINTDNGNGTDGGSTGGSGSSSGGGGGGSGFHSLPAPTPNETELPVLPSPDAGSTELGPDPAVVGLADGRMGVETPTGSPALASDNPIIGLLTGANAPLIGIGLLVILGIGLYIRGRSVA